LPPAMCRRPANLVAWSNAWLGGCRQAMPAVCWVPAHQQQLADAMLCTSEWQHARAARQAPLCSEPDAGRHLCARCPVLTSNRPPRGCPAAPIQVLSLQTCLIRPPLTPHSVHPGGLLHHPCCLVWRSSPCAPYCPASEHTHKVQPAAPGREAGVCALSALTTR
jgi:hypothetical protein